MLLCRSNTTRPPRPLTHLCVLYLPPPPPLRISHTRGQRARGGSLKIAFLSHPSARGNPPSKSRFEAGICRWQTCCTEAFIHQGPVSGEFISRARFLGHTYTSSQLRYYISSTTAVGSDLGHGRKPNNSVHFFSERGGALWTLSLYRKSAYNAS